VVNKNPIKVRHLTQDLDLSTDAVRELLDLASVVKRDPSGYVATLKGCYLSLLFEKPSLRTRLTFEVAIKQLGGDSSFSEGPVGGREPVKDVARNLDRWTSGIVARTFLQTTIDELAHWSGVPVINALSNLYHPCQALADVLTMKEHLGELGGRKLLLTATRLGVSVAVATPPGYEPRPEIVARAKELGAPVSITNAPEEAVAGADVVYTDVWASMGQEGQKTERLMAFESYQVNGKLMSRAKPAAVFMHCLPARRGEEVTDEVIESPQSVVFDQAENRLHAQKALLLMLL
jgi:ornithine carbamoyltransferase